MIDYAFDRFLRYDELVGWIDQLAAAHPDLVSVETHGRSFVRAAPGTTVTVTVRHQRAGSDSVQLALDR